MDQMEIVGRIKMLCQSDEVRVTFHFSPKQGRAGSFCIEALRARDMMPISEKLQQHEFAHLRSVHFCDGVSALWLVHQPTQMLVKIHQRGEDINPEDLLNGWIFGLYLPEWVQVGYWQAPDVPPYSSHLELEDFLRGLLKAGYIR